MMRPRFIRRAATPSVAALAYGTRPNTSAGVRGALISET